MASAMTIVRAWFRSLFRRRRADEELADELQAALQILIDRRVEQGHTRADARRLALLELGGIEQIKENVRWQRPARLVESVWTDVRRAADTLVRRPAFAVPALLVLVVTMSLTSGVFAVADALLFRPWPAPNPDRLAVVVVDRPLRDGGTSFLTGPAQYRYWRARARIFDLAAYVVEHADDGSGGRGLPVRLVSGNYFAVLGIDVIAGRGLSDRDDIRGQPAVVVTERLDVVSPIVSLPYAGDDARHLFLVRREHERAIREIAAHVHPATAQLTATPLGDHVRAHLQLSRIAAFIAGSVSLFALVVAAVGTFGVFSYLVEERQQEIGVRLALGAGPRSIVRALLGRVTWPLVLGISGGLAFGWAATALIRAQLYAVSPHDPISYLVVLAILTGTAALAIVLPARRAIRVDPVATLRRE